MKYFWGSDTYEARTAIQKLAEKQQATIKWLDQEDLKQDVGALVNQGASLFGASITVMRDPSVAPKALQEKILEQMDIEQGDNTVLWDRVKPDKRSKLWKTLKNNSEEFKESSFSELTSWLQKQAQEINVVIEDDAAGELIKRAGSDKWRLLNELRRLALMITSSNSSPEKGRLGGVGKHLIEQEVALEESAEIFSALDDLIGKNSKGAIEKIEILLLRGESEFYVLTMLAYQFRTLLKIKRGETAGISPYVINKGRRATAHFSDESLVGIITKIMATDVAIKQGKVDARTGLLMLVLTLAN